MILKRLVIGDIHGHWDNFVKIYNAENPDEVIILGDYFDNFHGTDESILDCFDNLLELQDIHNKYKKGKFIMLIGNHDYHYFSDIESYSGYRRSYAYLAKLKLTEALAENKLKYVHIDNENKIIYSHAGVTNCWLKANNLYDVDLNFINDVNINAFRFTYKNGGDSYGSSLYSSPIWIRPEALVMDCYEDSNKWTWTQIVGHTHESNPIIVKQDGKICYSIKQAKDYIGSYRPNMSEPNIIYCIDCMPKYYMVELFDNKTKKINNRNIIYNTLLENE